MDTFHVLISRLLVSLCLGYTVKCKLGSYFAWNNFTPEEKRIHALQKEFFDVVYMALFVIMTIALFVLSSTHYTRTIP